MIKKILLFSILVILINFLAGCGSNYSFEPSKGQNNAYIRGIPLTMISDDIVDVSLSPTSFNNRFAFSIYIINKSVNPINITIKDIQAFTNKGTANVFTYEEIKAEIENAAFWSKLSASLKNSAEIYNNALAGSTYSSGSGTAYSNDGTYVNAYTSGYSYDQNKVNQANAISNAQYEDQVNFIENQRNSSISNIANQILRKETIFSGQKIDRNFVLNIENFTEVTNLTIKVSIATKDYEFKYNMVVAQQ